jgi:hypothetical protein
MSKLKIYQEKISGKHLDSFWYEGLIAEYNGCQLYACGEIKGVFEGSTLTGNQIAPYILEKGDKALEKIDLIDNNWYEIFLPDEDYVSDAQDYDSAIDELVEQGKNYGGSNL